MAEYTDCPATNMWCAHTKKLSTAMPMLDAGHEFVAEDVLAREAGDDLADDAHAGRIMM